MTDDPTHSPPSDRAFHGELNHHERVERLNELRKVLSAVERASQMVSAVKDSDLSPGNHQPRRRAVPRIVPLAN